MVSHAFCAPVTIPSKILPRPDLIPSHMPIAVDLIPSHNPDMKDLKPSQRAFALATKASIMPRIA